MQSDDTMQMAKTRPDAFTVHWNKALALQKNGQLDEAVSAYTRAIDCQPEHTLSHYNLAVIYQQTGHPEKAARHYVEALKRNPGWDKAQFNLACCQHAINALDDAATLYRCILNKDPHHVDAAKRLSVIYLQEKKPTEALVLLQRIAHASPSCAQTYNNIGKAHLMLAHIDLARDAFQHAVSLDERLAEAWFNLGELDHQRGSLESAIAHYEKAVQCDPQMGAAFNNMGNVLKHLKRYPEAIAAFEKAVAITPGLPQAHYNLGSAHRLNEQFKQAVHHLGKAVALAPDYADAWNNLGLTFKNVGDWDRAMACFDKSVQIDSNLAVARWNRSFVHHLMNNWIDAWNDFEYRFFVPHHKSIYPHRIQGTQWEGETGRVDTLLVHDEQGLGDTLQFVRFLPRAKASCKTLILETREPLITLLRQMDCIDELIERDPKGPPDIPFDRYIPLMSLPRLFTITASSACPQAAYLHAAPDDIAHWQERIILEQKNIGLVWAGRPEHGNDANRSCTLAQFIPLMQSVQAKFIGLQKGPASDQAISFARQDADFENWGEDLHTFADTAAVIHHLDLVITVDTSVAHLAGAMGRPVWVLIPFIPDWRWGTSGSFTPWYPTMRLFRQSSPKDWTSVLKRVENALKQTVPTVAGSSHKVEYGAV